MSFPLVIFKKCYEKLAQCILHISCNNHKLQPIPAGPPEKYLLHNDYRGPQLAKYEVSLTQAMD